MIEIISYVPELKQYFYDINKEWVSEMFVMEDIDEQVCRDPETYIIKPGGKVWFANHPDHGIVGTCALLKKGENTFELTKMGV